MAAERTHTVQCAANSLEGLCGGPELAAGSTVLGPERCQFFGRLAMSLELAAGSAVLGPERCQFPGGLSSGVNVGGQRAS